MSDERRYPGTNQQILITDITAFYRQLLLKAASNRVIQTRQMNRGASPTIPHPGHGVW